MVKGTSRRVIVVDSPDPKLFEQAIFIVKNEAFAKEGVTSQQVLGEACRIAQGYAARQDRGGGGAGGGGNRYGDMADVIKWDETA